ncbi:MAG: AmmeMemoRadiSam system protein A [Candidatus Kryptonium sp.]|nr:AmmeMemoRadiSam system protein A [Candidatus Kryptonium sp.]MCX7762143.1 AmmeMemoRadiSam system protein A [Candidatus Kryptonium sp.]MDW8109007.1 AmmeMemoRadiSam system protein A [Candidatus Kryptonium sp.]
MNLTDEEKIELLRIARNSIVSVVNGGDLPEVEPKTENLKTPCGAFVTLTINDTLRGCIGYVEAVKSLAETVNEVAAKSALEDPRFPPVEPFEIDKIEIEISVLSPLSAVESIDEIKIGEHGLMIKKGWRRGLLLPQVAIEHNLTKEEFLEHTCLKAGLPPDCWKDKDTEIFKFTAIVFKESDFKLKTGENI